IPMSLSGSIRGSAKWLGDCYVLKGSSRGQQLANLVHEFALSLKLLGSGPHVLLDALLFFAGQRFHLGNVLLCWRSRWQRLIWRAAGFGKSEIELLSRGKLPTQLSHPPLFSLLQPGFAFLQRHFPTSHESVLKAATSSNRRSI